VLVSLYSLQVFKSDSTWSRVVPSGGQWTVNGNNMLLLLLDVVSTKITNANVIKKGNVQFVDPHPPLSPPSLSLLGSCQNSPKVHSKFTQSSPKVHPKFTQSSPKVHPKFTQRSPKVHPKFTQRSPKVHPKFTQS